MICKNCSSEIAELTNYCGHCGARVVRHRITLKGIMTNLIENIFGWDNTFFLTVRKMISGPQDLLGEYLNGTRKKYMAPFTFLALGSAVALFLFNIYSDAYTALNVQANEQSMDMMAKIMEQRSGGNFDADTFKKKQLEIVTKYTSFLLDYFNIFVLLLLPLYTLMAKLVYGKPYNYAEHLVINSYIQGITFWATTIIFVISIYTHPTVYTLSVLFSAIFYLYAYGKLYRLSVAESILKLFLFLALLIGGMILLFFLSFILGYTLGHLI